MKPKTRIAFLVAGAVIFASGVVGAALLDRPRSGESWISIKMHEVSDFESRVLIKTGTQDKRVLSFLYSIYLPLYNVYNSDPRFNSYEYFPAVFTFFAVIWSFFGLFIFGRWGKTVFALLTAYLLAGYYILH